MNPSHRRAGWRHRKDGTRVNVNRLALPHPRDRRDFGPFRRWSLRPGRLTFATFGGLARYCLGQPKRAEFSLYIDGHKVPGVTRVELGDEPFPLKHTDTVILDQLADFDWEQAIARQNAKPVLEQIAEDIGKVSPSFTLQTKPSSDDPIGEILRNSPHPFRGVDLKPVLLNDAKPEKFTIEQFKKDVLKVYGDGLHADINAPSPLLQILNVQEPCENLTNAATVSTWSNQPEYTLEQLKADIAEFRDRFPSPPETMFERVQREMGKVLFNPIPPAYFDESFDQVVTAEFERMKKLIWPKDDAEPEARMMLYEAIVTELRRRRKLGIPDPKYLRAQEPSEGEGES